MVDWPNGVLAVHVDTGAVRTVTEGNIWHAAASWDGQYMVGDTNFPDRGLQLFHAQSEAGADGTAAVTLCLPRSSSRGDHWAGPYPYDGSFRPAYAPQHTHPHPTFSPDNARVVYTSDVTGYSQVYEVMLNGAGDELARKTQSI